MKDTVSVSSVHCSARSQASRPARKGFTHGQVRAVGLCRHTGRARGGGGHGAHQLMVGICTARLRAHCGEEFGCLLVPQLECRKYGYKHGMEGPYEREVMLFHLPVH